ncbi:MAG: 1-deoxy-D-xylulose-5-phosphate synthase, partial [Sutterella sp.]|nr:1-deoxy-D-xylulose-5-phosphate synthase [Sutterella sp.]
LEAARTHELIVTAEEGALMGGAGDAVMEVLSDAGVAIPVMRFGIPDEFIEQGTQKEIYELLGLTPQAIEARVRERLASLDGEAAEA